MIDRTIKNLDYINLRRKDGNVFEVTQLVNSFSSVVGQPWDRLLDEKELRKLDITDTRFAGCGFPTLQLHTKSQRVAAANLKVDIATAEDYLRFMRNSMAHGNFELLNLRELRKYRQRGTLPSVKEREIAGLLLWNCPNGSTIPNREAALSVFELESILRAMQKLCMKRSLWIKSVLQDQKDREMVARRRTA